LEPVLENELYSSSGEDQALLAASTVFPQDAIQEVRSVLVEEFVSWSVVVQTEKPTAAQVAGMLLLMRAASQDADLGLKLTLIYPSDSGMGLGIDVYWNPTETTKTADLEPIPPRALLVGSSERDKLSLNSFHVGRIVCRRNDVTVDDVERVEAGVDTGSWLLP
jgi:hypothetical protein